MPLYAYRCIQCGNKFEKIQKFSAEPEIACPKCGGELERPLTAPTLQFKGAGWYVNDYAPKAASNSSDKPDGDKPGGDKSGGDKGGEDAAKPDADSKPASESKPAAESQPSAGESASKPVPSASSTTT